MVDHLEPTPRRKPGVPHLTFLHYEVDISDIGDPVPRFSEWWQPCIDDKILPTVLDHNSRFYKVQRRAWAIAKHLDHPERGMMTSDKRPDKRP